MLKFRKNILTESKKYLSEDLKRKRLTSHNYYALLVLNSKGIFALGYVINANASMDFTIFWTDSEMNYCSQSTILPSTRYCIPRNMLKIQLLEYIHQPCHHPWPVN